MITYIEQISRRRGHSLTFGDFLNITHLLTDGKIEHKLLIKFQFSGTPKLFVPQSAQIRKLSSPEGRRLNTSRKAFTLEDAGSYDGSYPIGVVINLNSP